MSDSRKDIYEVITNRFIEQLKRGTVPWQKPWISTVQNIVSRKPYRGINAFILGTTDRTSPYWLTFKQALELGGHIKKGEKSQPVIYYKLLEKRDAGGNPVLRDDGQPIRVPLVRWANVFNLDQAEGIAAPHITSTQNTGQPLERATAIVKDAKLCPIFHEGFAALYSPKDDVIRLPAPTTFHSKEAYYQTLFHEMTHATGHEKRLNREGITQPIEFGSPRYSKEEMIAELGASFLANEAGILNQVEFENSAAYLDHWIKRLSDDPKLIVSAASQAQRASDLIRGVQHQESLEESQAMPLTPAKEQGIDTRIPSFTHRGQVGDGVSNLIEGKQGSRSNDRNSRPHRRGMHL